MLNLTIKIRLHLQKSSHLFFSPKIAIFVLSCKEIRRRRRRNGQAGARPCKRTVGDAGIGTEKAPQTADIHQAYKCAGAPLSAQRSLFTGVPFLLPIRRKERGCLSPFCKGFDRFPEPEAEAESSSRQTRGNTQGSGVEKRVIRRSAEKERHGCSLAADFLYLRKVLQTFH